jgi:hypothetical protein
MGVRRCECAAPQRVKVPKETSKSNCLLLAMLMRSQPLDLASGLCWSPATDLPTIPRPPPPPTKPIREPSRETIITIPSGSARRRHPGTGPERNPASSWRIPRCSLRRPHPRQNPGRHATTIRAAETRNPHSCTGHPRRQHPRTGRSHHHHPPDQTHRAPATARTGESRRALDEEFSRRLADYREAHFGSGVIE